MSTKSKGKSHKPPPMMDPLDEEAWKMARDHWESQGGLAGFWKAVEEIKKAGVVNDDPFAEFAEEDPR